MGEPAPSFQQFVKQAAPIPANKKVLPPSGPIVRRGSSSSPPRSRSAHPANSSTRRSSSVYSRTVSQWEPDGMLWRSGDLADYPVPPVPLLPPLAYSASTPQLVERAETPPLLQPRTYRPIDRAPTPPAIEPAVKVSVRDDRMTVWPRVDPLSDAPPRLYSLTGLDPIPKIPAIPPVAFLPKVQIQHGGFKAKHIRTISLEEAKAAVRGGGAIPMLPEELRANVARRSRSHDNLQMLPADIYAHYQVTAPAQPATLIDVEGRRRNVLSVVDITGFTGGAPRAPPNGGIDQHDFAFGSGSDHKTMTTPAIEPQRQEHLKANVLQSHLDREFDEPRGRTMQRGPGKLEHKHSSSEREYSALGSKETPVAHKLAEEYHNLLAAQYRSTSSKPTQEVPVAGSNNDMKMVPRPLFHNKPPAKLPGDIDLRNNDRRLSPFSLNSFSRRRDDSTESWLQNNNDMMAPKLAIAPACSHARHSTSGSIPISPPEDHLPPNTRPTGPIDSPTSKQPSNTSRKAKNARASAYYPHIAPRKAKKKSTNKAKKRASGSGYPPLPPLPREGVYRIADSRSPHLHPSPATDKPKEIHLGWSDVAKSAFDKVTSPGLAPSKTAEKYRSPQFTHIIGPPRPLDERDVMSAESEMPQRKGSIFGALLDSWKESKAEKRREELKKQIKYVPAHGVEATSDRRGSLTRAFTT